MARGGQKLLPGRLTAAGNKWCPVFCEEIMLLPMPRRERLLPMPCRDGGLQAADEGSGRLQPMAVRLTIV